MCVCVCVFVYALFKINIVPSFRDLGIHENTWSTIKTFLSEMTDYRIVLIISYFHLDLLWYNLIPFHCSFVMLSIVVIISYSTKHIEVHRWSSMITCSLLSISGLLCGLLPVEGGAVFGRTDLCPLVAGVTGAGVEFQVVQGRRRQTDMA